MLLEKKTHNKYDLKLKHSNHVLKFGKFGIKAISFGRLTEAQLNSMGYLLIKTFKSLNLNKKSIKTWNLVCLNMSLTKLSSESRMGKGKGSVYTKAAFLKPGTILLEFDGTTSQQSLLVFRKLNKSVNLKLALVTK